MLKSKIVALTSFVLVIVLALLCGFVFAMDSSSHNDALAADTHTSHDGWTDLNSYGSTMLATGNYYLSADFTGDLTLESYAKVTLCLNGYKLTGTGSSSVITVGADQSLTLEDCNLSSTSHQYYVDSTGLWVFDDGSAGWDTAYAEAGAEKQGTVTGGVITGGNATNGGGVNVNGSNSTLIINGGTISGNTTTANGGGVYVNGGVFTMIGGTISGNTATQNGGGVSLDSSSNFAMEGGIVADNTATSTGNGVYLASSSASFTIFDGYIKDTIDNSINGTINITGGYFVDGDADANQIQSFVLEGELQVVALTEDDEAYALGYRYTVKITGVTFRISTTGSSQYDGSAIANKNDFTVFVTVGAVESPEYDFTFQYAPQGTEEYIDGLPVNAGQYTIKVSLTYQGTLYDHTFEYEVTKRTVTIAAVDREYDGTNVVQLVLNGMIEGDDLYLSSTTATIDDVNAGNGKVVNVGEVTLQGSSIANYEFSAADVYVDITPRQLAVSWNTSEFVYNGQQQNPINPTLDTGIDGQSFTLGEPVIPESINKGDYTITVEAIPVDGTLADNYDIQGLSFEYKILPKTITVTWDGVTEYVYNGQQQNPINPTLDTGIDGQSFTLGEPLAPESINKGDYTITVEATPVDGTLADNYDIQGLSFEYKILPKTITVTWDGVTEYVYNGQIQKPNVPTLDTGVDGQSFTLSATFADSINKGDYTATVEVTAVEGTDANNYDIQGTTFDYQIVPRVLTVQWLNARLVYNGLAKVITAVIDTGVEGVTVDLLVTSPDFVNAGTHTATATMAVENNNFVLTNDTFDYTIEQRVITVVWDNTQLVYNGKAQLPTATAIGLGGRPLVLNVTGAQSAVGTYTAEASLDDNNYKLDNASTQYTIAPKSISVVWGSAEFTYNGQLQKPTATVDTGVAGESLLVTVSVDGGINAGQYTATATIDNGNYTLTGNTLDYSIGKATANVVWADTSFAQDKNAHKPTATAVGVDGNALNLTVTGEQTVAGKYVAVATTDNANYVLANANTKFEITEPAINGITTTGIVIDVLAVGALVGMLVVVLRRKSL